MATLHAENLSLSITYHSLYDQSLLWYSLSILWNGEPLINPAILKENMAGDAFLFTLDSFDPNDYLLSFFEQLLKKREDTRLENFVEPDVKISVYTWKGKLPWLKHKYGNSINVGQGMEPFESGIEKLAEQHGNNVELVIRLPYYHFQGGSPAPENWRRQQYVIIAINTNFTDLEQFHKELHEEFKVFQSSYPELTIIASEFNDPFD